MITRRINLDEASDHILQSIAEDYDGDADRALSDLLHAHESIEAFLDEFEASHRTELLAQKERAELGFAHGRFTPWDEVKRQNDL
jgi:hypothetical protein